MSEYPNEATQSEQRSPRATSRTRRRLDAEAAARPSIVASPLANLPQTREAQTRGTRTQRNAKAVQLYEEPQREPMRSSASEGSGRGRARHKASYKSLIWFSAPAVALIIAFVLLLSAKGMMAVTLAQNEVDRQADHQRVLSNHPLRYRELIEAAAAQNNLKPAFMAAIILNESSFRPEATSSVGARGLMQVMEATAGWIAEKLSETGSYSFDMMYKA